MDYRDGAVRHFVGIKYCVDVFERSLALAFDFAVYLFKLTS